MKSNFKRPFAQYVKKAHKPLQLAIEDEVEVVCEAPKLVRPKWVISLEFDCISSGSVDKSI